MAYRATARTEAKKTENREKILNAAHLLILEGGFKAISMSGVAKLAKVATGSMYRYFPNKVELCTELFRQLSGNEVEELAKVATLEASAAARLANCCYRFIDRAFRGPVQSYALIAEPLDPALEAERLIFRRAYAAVFKVIIQDGIDACEFSDQDASFAASAMVGMLTEPLIEPLWQASSLQALPSLNKKTLQTLLATMCLRSLGFSASEPLPTQIGNSNER